MENQLIKDVLVQNQSINVNIYNSFTYWIKSNSTKQLNEIQKLEGLSCILEAELGNMITNKLGKGISLNSSDMKKIRLNKDILCDLHKLKNTNRTKVQRDLTDIRDIMFEKS